MLKFVYLISNLFKEQCRTLFTETEVVLLLDSSMQQLFGPIVGVNVTRFVFHDASGMVQLPDNAPPPKLHYSTWWRRTARRLYQTEILNKK